MILWRLVVVDSGYGSSLPKELTLFDFQVVCCQIYSKIVRNVNLGMKKKFK